MEDNIFHKFSYRLVYDRKHENKTENLIQVEIYNPGNRRRVYITTHVHVMPDQWDSKYHIVINREDAEYLNACLYNFKNSIEHIEMDYRIRNVKCSLSTLKMDVKMKKKVHSGNNFYSFIEKYIEQPSERKQATIDNLKGTLKSLKNYKPTVTFDQLDISFVNGYEKFLFNNDNSVNTVAKQMTNLKLFINQAILEKYMHSEENPFVYYKPKAKEKRHRALEKSVVEKIEGYAPKRKHMEKIRDAFLFCCYTGLRYSDFVTLANEHISQDSSGKWWVKKKCVKTGTPCAIPISEIYNGKAVAILEKYEWNVRKLNRIGSNGEVNKDLKEMYSDLKLSLPFSLSWHVSRHTFATLLIEMGLPINVVSKLLGHSSVRMSETYCDTTDSAIVTAIEQQLKDKKKKKN